MAVRLNDFIRGLGYAALAREANGLTDTELLERFLTRRDEAAFAALVRRHGPMVLSVCRRLLRHTQDAEDAFQATFLVLVRKAASIARRELLGNWLYGVAYRTASKARVAVARRHLREQQVNEMPSAESTPRESDVLAVLDEELNRLPEKYRTPLVLCDLEGRPRGEAAQRLGCPLGTLSSRLARGRQMLRQRLVRRGVSLTTATLTAILAESASAAVPASLFVGTIRTGLLCASGLGVVSAPVAALTEGVLKTMLLTKLKITTVVVLALAVAGTGAGMFLDANPAAQTPAETPKTHAKADKGPNQPRNADDDSLTLVSLLERENVQRELKLSDKQLTRIRKVRENVRAKHNAQLEKVLDGAKEGPEGIDRALRELSQIKWKMRTEESEALLKALPDLLTDNQRRRLRQLSLQACKGVVVFTNAEVVKALKLTEGQRKQVAVIAEETQKEFDKKFLHKVGNETFLGPIEAAPYEEMMRTAFKKVMADVLTVEQKSMWKEMLGKPLTSEKKAASDKK